MLNITKVFYITQIISTFFIKINCYTFVGMKQLKETRGKKPLKTFKIGVGELKNIDLKDRHNFRYRAKQEGWKIQTRILNGKMMVFRVE
jgi:hypothetical protein